MTPVTYTVTPMVLLVLCILETDRLNSKSFRDRDFSNYKSISLSFYILNFLVFRRKDIYVLRSNVSISRLVSPPWSVPSEQGLLIYVFTHFRPFVYHLFFPRVVAFYRAWFGSSFLPPG